MRYLFLILLVASATGCGQSAWDSEVSPYINEFLDIGQVQNLPETEVILGEVPGEAIGVCNHYSNGKKQIILDHSYWNQATEVEKTILVWHELGHCVLDRRHMDIMLPDTCPYSIMYYQQFDTNCFDKHYDHYVQELFNE